MDAISTLAVADDPPLTPDRKLAAREKASAGLLLLILILVLSSLLFMVIAITRSRRNARFRAMKADTTRRRQAMTDAWVESGKRIEVPEPEEMERDRLNLDDTDMEGRPPPEDPPDAR